MLGWQHLPAEYLVAMRKTTKTANDGSVKLAIFHPFQIAAGGAKRDATFLVGKRLRMHERHVDEASLRHRERLIEASRDRSIGNAAL